MAEEYFILALQLNPQMKSIKHELAIMYEKMLDIEKSDSLFKQIIFDNKDDALGLNDYAYINAER